MLPHQRRWRWWHDPNLTLKLKSTLEKELLRVLVPKGPKLGLHLVDFPTRDLEAYRLIRFSSEQYILPLPVWWLNPLFICRHKAMPWGNVVRYFWVVNLEEETLLPVLWVPLLGHAVARSTYFDETLCLYAGFVEGGLGIFF
jgi:hypothetical protein